MEKYTVLEFDIGGKCVLKDMIHVFERLLGEMIPSDKFEVECDSRYMRVKLYV